jgi:lipopolysaccharide transport system permease protein
VTSPAVLPLIFQLTEREIEARYRGSALGWMWSIITPLMLLAVFTFVFTSVLPARWGNVSDNKTEFALIIFAGLITFSVFSEVVGRAPSLITSQPNLVKKVVFPLEILPVVTLLVALAHAVLALFILGAAQIAFGAGPHSAFLFVPALFLPVSFFTLGLGWFLAAFGVYVRDISQVIPPVLTAALFLSPVFYPSTNFPEWIRPYASLNPLAYSIETIRDALIFGTLPSLVSFVIVLLGSVLIAALGYAFFRKTRKGFADVL